mgnify:CR=1 FL=1
MNNGTQDVWEIKKALFDCAETHRKATPQDYVKRIYQSEFGGGHMIDDPAESLRRLREEIAGLTPKQQKAPYFDPFCSQFARMNLSVAQKVSPEVINRVFVASSREVPEGAWDRMEEKFRILWVLTRDFPELFPFTSQEWVDYVTAYTQAGGGPLHHSEAYRKAYQPAYRVVRKEFSEFLSLYEAMERTLAEKGTVSVAIDGHCGSGKTRLAALLEKLYDCNVFHADDYFLTLAQRTPERLAEVGGNMDRERFQAEVLEGVRSGKPFTYRPFNCSVMALDQPVQVQPKAVNIFEGSYTMHPQLRAYYDFAVFLTVSPTTQQARILARNGDVMLRRFLEEWIPKENAYFEQMQVPQACRFVY